MDWYSGEKTNSVTLPINSYTYIDPTRFEKPEPGEGTVRYYLYLNLDLALKAKFLTGVLRLRAVREPIEDSTAYLDLTVTRKNCKIDSSSLDSTSDVQEWLITHEWMGAADGDYDHLRWDIKIGPEFASAKMTTRYAKAWVV